MADDIARIGIEFDTSSLRKGEQALRDVREAGRRTSSSMEGVESAVQQAGAGFRRLGGTVDVANSGLGRYNRNVRDATGATRQFGASARQTSQNTDRLADSFRQATSRAGGYSERMSAATSRQRNFGIGAQNAAFQLQDFVTQVASGTDATRSLGQQLPQLLGQFGVFGAVAGAAVAVAGGLARSLFSASDGMSAAESATKAFEKAQEATNRTVASGIDGLDDLAEKYDKLTKKQRELERLNLESAIRSTKNAIDEQREAISNIVKPLEEERKKIERIRRSAVDLDIAISKGLVNVENPRQLIKVFEAIDRFEQGGSAVKLAKDLDALAPTLGANSDQAREVVDEVIKLADELAKQEKSLDKNKERLEAFKGALIESAEAQKRLNESIRSGTIATEAGTGAVANSVAAQREAIRAQREAALAKQEDEEATEKLSEAQKRLNESIRSGTVAIEAGTGNALSSIEQRQANIDQERSDAIEKQNRRFEDRLGNLREEANQQRELVGLTEEQRRVEQAVNEALARSDDLTESQRRRLERVVRETERQKIANEEVQEVIDGIEDSLSGIFEDILRDEKSSFKDFLDDIEELFVSTLADMAAKAAKQKIVANVDFFGSASGGGFGNAAATGGGGLSIPGFGGGSFNIGNINPFGGGSQGINPSARIGGPGPLGGETGVSVFPSGSGPANVGGAGGLGGGSGGAAPSTGGFSFGNAFASGATGFAAGNVTDSLLGIGNTGEFSGIGGDVGSIAGSIAGSAFGPIGTVAGGVLGEIGGSFIGGLFGNDTPPRGIGNVSVDAQGRTVGARDVDSSNRKDLSQEDLEKITKGTTAAIQGAVRAAGAQLNDDFAVKNNVNDRKRTAITPDFGRGPGDIQVSDDPNDLSAVIREIFLNERGTDLNIQGVSERERTAVRNTEPDAKPEQLINNIDFAAGFEDRLRALRNGVQDFSETLRGAEVESLRNLTNQVRTFLDTTEQTGLDVEAAEGASTAFLRRQLGITEGRDRKALSETAQQNIQLETRLKKINDETSQFAGLLQDLGISLDAAAEATREQIQANNEQRRISLRASLLEDGQASAAGQITSFLRNESQALTEDVRRGVISGGLAQRVSKNRVGDAVSGLDRKQITNLRDFFIENQQQIEDSAIAISGLNAALLEMSKSAEEATASQSDVVDARQTLIDQLKEEQDELRRTADKFANIQDQLAEFQRGIQFGQDSALSPRDQVRQARQDFEQTRRRALGRGDVSEEEQIKAQQKLPDVAQQFLDSARGFFASGEGFQNAFNLVNRTLDQVENEAKSEEQRLREEISNLGSRIDAQKGALEKIGALDEPITTLSGAIDNLRNTIANAGKGVDTGGPAQPRSGGGTTFLEAGGSTTAGRGEQVFGRRGSNETVRLGENPANVGFDANIENLKTNRDLSNLSAKSTESGLELKAGNKTLATIPSLNQDLSLSGKNGSTTLSQTGATEFSVGGGKLGLGDSLFGLSSSGPKNGSRFGSAEEAAAAVRESSDLQIFASKGDTVSDITSIAEDAGIPGFGAAQSVEPASPTPAPDIQGPDPVAASQGGNDTQTAQQIEALRQEVRQLRKATIVSGEQITRAVQDGNQSLRNQERKARLEATGGR